MDARRSSAIALGGILGAAVRWVVVTAMAADGNIPWGVLAVNVAGSFILGVLLAEEWNHPRARVLLHDAGGIGFCGGLTTFSAVSVDIAAMLGEGDAARAVSYGLLSFAGSVVAVVAGAATLRRVRALALPLEEQP